MSEPLVLEGRDAIRKYLASQGVNRSWKTIAKWAKEHGLPVKKNDATHMPYASPVELDNWILRFLIGKD